MMRKDLGARDNECMTDGSGCDGYGAHQLCCPPNQDLPTCGWYTHNHGKCDNQCPLGKTEIGSNNAYCQTGSMNGLYGLQRYQAACYTSTTENLKLYDQCSWTQWPECYKDASCPGSNELVAASGDGNGAAVCWGSYSRREADYRKYCCDNDDENSKWSDCAWHKDQSQGSTLQPAVLCYANCPENTVRVAMDSHECHGAAQAKCCTPNIKTITKRQSSEDDMYEMYLKIFLGDPVCDTNPVCGHGDAGMANIIHNGDLVAFNTQQYMIARVTALFWGSP